MMQHANAKNEIKRFFWKRKMKEVGLGKMDIVARPNIRLGRFDRITEVNTHDFSPKPARHISIASHSTSNIQNIFSGLHFECFQSYAALVDNFRGAIALIK